jgi:hypothetical protein
LNTHTKINESAIDEFKLSQWFDADVALFLIDGAV